MQICNKIEKVNEYNEILKLFKSDDNKSDDEYIYPFKC